MFGYIGTIESELKVREAASYSSWYCGLCKCMKRRYGPFSSCLRKASFVGMRWGSS